MKVGFLDQRQFQFTLQVDRLVSQDVWKNHQKKPVCFYHSASRESTKELALWIGYCSLDQDHQGYRVQLTNTKLYWGVSLFFFNPKKKRTKTKVQRVFLSVLASNIKLLDKENRKEWKALLQATNHYICTNFDQMITIFNCIISFITQVNDNAPCIMTDTFKWARDLVESLRLKFETTQAIYKLFCFK